ncbi:MAG: PBP1A family penicillin-binding protein [Spirochaetales bacterium]|nr:PBP1A family penicillin-binding protein [Leptospiraceae bacterium]MCP5480608.1 PBP1A family penicillin-binding protein [Spirochaetales bacterium]MCP5483958.1 PBP1A family penicillin-binding protein [Spirochaetales bacterium]
MESQSDPYRSSIFSPPGRSGIFSRSVFFAFNLIMARRLGPSDGRALLKALGGAVFLGLLCIGLVAGTPLDLWLVFEERGYNQPSQIFAVGPDGEDMMIAEIYTEFRRVIHLEPERGRGLDSRVAQAFIATEDNKFESHLGVDFEGILRAAVVNAMAMRVKEGASTITQQVARLRYLSRERSLVRKLREAFLAVLIELRYSKREIMEMYLNMVPLGHGTNGIEAAAQFYFGKGFLELSWGEAAVLSAMTTSPNTFSPLRSPDNSRDKVQVVLRRLFETGHLNLEQMESEYSQLEQGFYTTLNRSPRETASGEKLNLHPYVTSYVWVNLLEGRQPWRYSRWRMVNGGLRIYTTINHQHQSAAEQEFIRYLREQTARRKRPPFNRYELFYEAFGELPRLQSVLRDYYGLPEHRFDLDMSRVERDFLRAYSGEGQTEASLMALLTGTDQMDQAFVAGRERAAELAEEEQAVEGALISIRPRTGEITAIVGGSGMTAGNQQMRFETAYRQPGSAFKPIVYASGIEATGLDPDRDYQLTAATLVDDSPQHFVNRDLSEYSPENYSRSYDGLMRLRRALTLSKNSVAVQVYRNVGPDAINPIAARILDLDSRPSNRPHSLPAEATVALGSFGVTPLEMARAYAVFASGGQRVYPYIVDHITDSTGQVIYDSREERARQEVEQVISPGTAMIITSMLQDVVEEGTGRAARMSGRPVAGKTGTTNRNKNAWFVGFTPNLVTAVYVGYDRPISLGGGATGGGLAAPVWGRYMHRALAGEPGGRFEFEGSTAYSVEICESTGALPGRRCPRRMTELFLPGTAPTEANDELEAGAGQDGVPAVIIDDEDVLTDEDL